MITKVISRQANNCSIYLPLRMAPNKEKLYRHWFLNFVLQQGLGTNRGRQAAQATKFCTVLANICESSVCNCFTSSFLRL